jgi:hypothetical protein
MPYRSEDLERGVDALLQANLSAALDTAQSRWASIDAETLPDPVSYVRGYRTLMLELPSTAFPIVLTWAHARAPFGPVQTGLQQVEPQITIEAVVVADTEAALNRIAHRYLEAIVAVLQTSRSIAGYTQVNREPATNMTQNIEHLKHAVSGDVYKATDLEYMRVVTVTVLFRGYGETS